MNELGYIPRCLPFTVRTHLAIFLVFALALLGVSNAVPTSAECAAPGGVVEMGAGCAESCCPETACCVKRTPEQPQPAPAQSAPRGATTFAAILPHLISCFYELPPVARAFVISGDAAEAHSLPPLAASCIRLI